MIDYKQVVLKTLSKIENQKRNIENQIVHEDTTMELIYIHRGMLQALDQANLYISQAMSECDPLLRESKN